MSLVARIVALMPAIFSLACTHHIAPVRQFAPVREPMSAIAWSSDSRTVAFAAPGGEVTVWDVETGQQIALTTGYRPHQMLYQPTGMAFSRDGRWLAFGTDSGAVRLWDFRVGVTRDLPRQSRPVLVAAFSPDGARLAIATGGMTYPPPLPATTRATRSAASTTRPYPVIEPVTVIVFDVASGTEISRVEAPGFLNITFSSDIELFAGPRVATATATTWPLRMDSGEMLAGGDVQVCRVRDGGAVQQFPGTGWWTAFSPDGTKLRSGVALWDIATGKRLGDVRNARTFTDGGRRMLLVEPGTPAASLWPVALATRKVRFSYLNVANGMKKDVGEFEPDEQHPISMALENPANFSPDGKYVVDRMMVLWRVPR
jgi:WD40 repeat protein